MSLLSLEHIKKLLQLQRLEEAKAALRDLDASGASTAESQYLLGTIYHRENNLGEAVDCFKRALLLDPKFTDAAISLSIIYNDTGHYEEGKAIFQQAETSVQNKGASPTPSIVLSKEISARHAELGDLYRKLQRFDEATNEYLKASRVDPENLEARILLAKTQGQRGQIKLASEELRQLVTEHPNYVPARIHLALLYYATGNAVDAQMELNEALMKEPHNEQVKMYLSMTRQATESTISFS